MLTIIVKLDYEAVSNDESPHEAADGEEAAFGI